MPRSRVLKVANPNGRTLHVRSITMFLYKRFFFLTYWKATDIIFIKTVSVCVAQTEYTTSRGGGQKYVLTSFKYYLVIWQWHKELFWRLKNNHPQTSNKLAREYSGPWHMQRAWHLNCGRLSALLTSTFQHRFTWRTAGFATRTSQPISSPLCLKQQTSGPAKMDTPSSSPKQRSLFFMRRGKKTWCLWWARDYKMMWSKSNELAEDTERVQALSCL